MRRLLLLTIVLASAPFAATAQSTKPPYVRAAGEAIISVKPDQAKVGIAIVTQATTADQASGDNATRAKNVFDKLRSTLGNAADIKTTNYSLMPVYSYNQATGTQTLTGYIATNSLEVTLEDLATIGRVIDTAVGAGATRVDGVRLLLKDEEPIRNQALRAAGQKARTRAEAIAAGVNGRLGRVFSAEEATAYRPIVADARAATMLASAPTPIETGMLEVRATITVEYELLQ